MSINWWERESLVKFECPTSIIVCGPTGIGKTILVKQILENAEGMFKVPPFKILYCYEIWQDIFDHMRKTIHNISFHQGLPDEQELNINNGKHSVCILDDLMTEAVDSIFVERLFCVGVHHLQWSTILILQNIFYKGRVMRTISLNCSVFILFRNYRDEMQIWSLARQMFPKDVKFFIDSYRKSTNGPHQYIVVDINPRFNREYQLRSRILPGQDVVIYVSKK